LIKLIFDRVFAFVALLVLSPVFIVVALWITITLKGSPFFTQKRVGLGGKLFSIIKFRTMVNGGDLITITSADDPRITKPGGFLRKWKLDELPQLVNVLIGDMSFVGPRPDVPGYADLLLGEDRRILSVRPGITGPATLKYYNEEEILAMVENPIEFNDKVIFPDKVKINLAYIKQQSFVGDMKIIIFTLLNRRDYEH
jgi:lipopolysaccharide/colanic/teichoic acid biosynthesis glycosyltransferase